MAEPLYFASRAEFCEWLAEHGATATELVVGFHKVGSGLAAFEKRTDRRSIVWACEHEGEVALPPELEKRFRRQRKARAWFEAQPPGWRRQTLRWVLGAKQAATPERRLDQLIEASTNGQRVR